VQEEQEIGRELFGYKKDDVDRSLAELHRDLKAVKEENERLSKELESADDRLSTYEEIAESMETTHGEEEKRATEIIDKAKAEAESIIAKASEEARSIIEAAGAEREAFKSEYDNLAISEQELHSKVKSILDHYLSLFSESKAENERLSKELETSVTPEPKPASGERRRVTMDMPTDKALLEKLMRLGDIQGVGTLWLFDNEGSIISSFNRLKINLPGITSALVSLERSAEQLETSLEESQFRLLFLQLEKIIIILNPITDSAMLGIIASVNAPIGQIFWYLDKEVPEFRRLLS